MLAFEHIEPGGARRDDYRAAHIAALFASAYLKRKGGGSASFKDFLLNFDGPAEADPAKLSRDLRAALGGKSKSKGKA